MPKVKAKKKSSEKVDWSKYFHEQNEILKADLGLLPKKKKEKKKETVWYYPRRNPYTGLIHHKTKPRKRSSGKKKDASSDGYSKDIAPQTEFYSEEHITGENDMTSILMDLQLALNIDVQEQDKSSWADRQEDLDASWTDIRADLMMFMIEGQSLPNKLCYKCQDEPAIINCKDCRQYFCVECDRLVHLQFFLHDRETTKDGFLRRIPTVASFPVIHPVKCRGCSVEGQSAERNTGSSYIAITLKGRRIIPRAEVYCQNCNFVDTKLELQTIVANGFWPATIRRIVHIFEADLLKFIDMLMKNMPGTSLSSIAKALQDIDESDKAVSRAALTRALMEYRYCQQALNDVKGTDGMTCPACSSGQHSAHVDGNFKVYRYSKVPRGSRKPYYEDVFIAPAEDVNRHMDTVYDDRRRPSQGDTSTCGNSHWRAAKSSAKARNKLDECGLEVAGCRHAVAQKAVNMFTGEQYGYPHYIHVKFLLPLKVKFLWQDVVCKYWPWAKKQGAKDAAYAEAVEVMKPALSVMHAKAHQWSCQENNNH
eukprot:XP_011676466.1 PREDICTED: uncharacterized protein LOC105444216 [Strongylocentrotus purpuratus]